LPVALLLSFRSAAKEPASAVAFFLSFRSAAEESAFDFAFASALALAFFLSFRSAAKQSKVQGCAPHKVNRPEPLLRFDSKSRFASGNLSRSYQRLLR
jgi:hypothetical protein